MFEKSSPSKFTFSLMQDLDSVAPTKRSERQEEYFIKYKVFIAGSFTEFASLNSSAESFERHDRGLGDKRK